MLNSGGGVFDVRGDHGFANKNPTRPEGWMGLNPDSSQESVRAVATSGGTLTADGGWIGDRSELIHR